MIHSPDLFFIVLLFIISGARSRPVHTHWCIRWQALGAQRSVKLCESGLHIRLQEDETNAKGNAAQQVPANKGKLEHKGVPLFTVHHLLAQLHGAAGGQVRGFRPSGSDLHVAIRPVNAGNDQKGTQRNFQVGQQHNLTTFRYGVRKIEVTVLNGVADWRLSIK